MQTVAVYSSRNNEDGTQPDNKMFWNTYYEENEDFNSQLQKMIAAHEKIYADFVVSGSKNKRIARVMDHPAYRELERILRTIYERNVCVILEMFLYSAKAVPGLLPSDNIDRPFTNRDISGAYARLLASYMDRCIREFTPKEDGNTYKNPSISGYIHVLKSWPRTGTWNEIQRLAIRVYGEMKETSREVEEVLYPALGKIYNYNSVFEVLLSAERRGHSKDRLMVLLHFVCTKYKNEKGARCTNSMCRSFREAVERLYEDDMELYHELQSDYQETRSNGISIKDLNEVFGITEEDPLKDQNGKSDTEIADYISGHYDPFSFEWRRWFKSLDKEFFFHAVRDNFERVVLPSGNINKISYMLCSFAEMRKLGHGHDYLYDLYHNSKFKQFMEDRPLHCVLLCACKLAGEPITMTHILELYESLSMEEVDAVQRTVRLLIRQEKNQGPARERIQEHVQKTKVDDDNSVIHLLDLLCKCYQFPKDAELRQAVIPTVQVMQIIRECCGLNQDGSMFRDEPSRTLLLVCINYIANDITWENKGMYKSFLQAARQTYVRDRAEKLILMHFSSDING